jgi:hypothetical protein
LGRIRTSAEITTGELLGLKTSLANTLKAELAKEIGRKPEEIVVRDVMASNDLGLDSELWDNELAAGIATVTWTKDWSKELPKNKMVAFYGIVNHTDNPTFVGYKFKVGANGQTTREVIMAGRGKAEDENKVLFDPIKYKPGETIYVEVYQASGSTVAEGAELVEYLALVAEPYGEMISEALPK